jgi:two-component system LytT family response regulator
LNDYFFIRTDHQYIWVPLEEIRYVEACKNYVRIVIGDRVVMSLISMKEMEGALPAAMFCRMHRSYIVSLHITSFTVDMICIGKQQIPLSSTYRNAFEKKIIMVTSEVRKTNRVEKCHLSTG